MTNELVYERSKAEPWRKKIVRKRLKWFGKLAALSEETPANKALRYGLSKFQRPRGKPKTTWISKVTKDLLQMNYTWDDAKTFAKENPNEWVRAVTQFVKTIT